ncbi:MAG: glycosyl transferase, group 1 [Bacteroidetes bacterium]|jgi:glycosyltransferase involved in cell wall biosynthesis|nr:glycosyl transferase, group 1 [Bacteroidota bacterium]
MNFLFLYTELADYFINCCEELSTHGTVHIIRWPVNKEAPFRFQFSDKLKIYDKQSYSFEQLITLVSQIKPDIIVCSGWIDKDYLKLVKPYFGKIPTVVACDTHWKGTMKQRLATFLSPFFLKNRFSHAWVPGQPQYNYVRKLGFSEKNTKRGFYCCDLNKFNSVYDRTIESKRNNFPKRFLYVGRYYDFKGITDLWQAFIELDKENVSEWELWCLGAGSIEPVQHPKIRHFGFVQPKDLEPILAQTGIFILPSRFEPWAVVVQEYGAAGFPLLLSNEVGAKDTFLEEGKNGFSFQKENVKELKDALKKIISLDDRSLLQMCDYSHVTAQKITPVKWSETVIEIHNEYRKK